MRVIHPQRRIARVSRCWLAVICLVAWSARAEKIQVYRVPKERPPTATAGGHFDGDGHDHGAVSPHGLRSVPKISYSKPEGWEELGAGEMRSAGFLVKGEGEKTAQVAVTPLPGMAGREALIINMWRQQVGQAELPEAEAANELREVEVGGATGKLFEVSGSSANGAFRIITAMWHQGEQSWFFKFQGDDALVTAQKEAFLAFLKTVKFESGPAGAAGSMAGDLPPGHPPVGNTATATTPPPARSGGPKWTVPADWKEVAGGQFLFAKFLLTGPAGEQAAVNVSVSAGDGGGLAANLNRWRAQLGQGSLSEAELEKLVTQIDVLGGQATYVEMSGTDSSTEKPAAILGAKVVRAGRTWYYKLMGEPALVAAQKANFVQFIQGVQY